MELSEGQIHKFAELERCYSQYFYGSVVPVMEQVRKDINDKQLKELKDYSNSFAGMMSMAASNPIGGGSRASIDMIAQTGTWSRMNTEEYISMCHERIGNSEKITADLKLIADEWRNELVSTIGRERYDVMSEFAPKLLSAEEVKEILTSKFSDVLATKNKGMIMKTVMGELKGKADGKVINQVVAELTK